MRRSQALCFVCVCVLLCACCRAFELQDTIHALIEENIHLHDQLENLTRALRELRQLLFQHSDDHTHEHDEELQHLWEEWSQHKSFGPLYVPLLYIDALCNDGNRTLLINNGITPETHLLLEHALCGHDLHGSAPSSSGHAPFIFIAFIVLAHFLL